jgi:protein-S-isoprenylcysteine O-methyltransferase Ste14
MNQDPSTRQRLGGALVAAQFGLLGWLALLAWPCLRGGCVPVGAWGLAAASAVLGLWALASNLPGNFNIRPTPRAGGRLVQQGPYRWVRHPMYTAVIAFGLACAWTAAVPWAWLGAVALVAVLLKKASLEERWMAEVHADYATYRRTTHRLLPGLY